MNTYDDTCPECGGGRGTQTGTCPLYTVNEPHLTHNRGRLAKHLHSLSKAMKEKAEDVGICLHCGADNELCDTTTKGVPCTPDPCDAGTCECHLTE